MKFQREELIFLLLVFVVDVFSVDPCTVEESIDISSGTHLSNGNIEHDNIVYKSYEYFKENKTGIERGCICKKERICARKCCPIGYQYHRVGEPHCRNTSEVFDPFIGDNGKRLSDDENMKKRFYFLYGKPKCAAINQTSFVLSSYSESNFLEDDGNLIIKSQPPPWIVLTPNLYCIDMVVAADETVKIDGTFCYTEDYEKDQNYVFKSSCMIISCVFILATVAVYSMLPELKSLHGRVLMAYLLCLLVAFTFLAAMQIMLVIQEITPKTCLGFTFVIYFALLAAFFWLNVMCFDIWWTFSGKRGVSNKSISGKYTAYSIYAFGFPTALTILLISLEFSGLPHHPLLPMLRRQGCFISGNSRMLYLYGPIIILCVANMIFFILTAIRIASISRQTSVLKSKESASTRDDKQRLFLYVKLFLIMGMSWILEVISAIYPEYDDTVWIYSDAYNILIGLILFVIFVCKKKIFKLIKKRYTDLLSGILSSRNDSNKTESSNIEMQEHNKNREIHNSQ